MSQKSKFIIASALSMSLFPYLLTLVPTQTIYVVAHYIYEVPLKLLLLNLNIPDSSLIIFVIWFFMGLLWGFILYHIRNQGDVEQVKFGFGAFFTTIFIWLFLGVMLIIANQFFIQPFVQDENILW